MSIYELKTNQMSWESAIKQHNIYKGDMAKIIYSQRGYVCKEIEDLFSEVNNKIIIQLFCNDGREILSLVKKSGRGIGVDFSKSAIDIATETNRTLKYDCLFICQEVMSWLSTQDQNIGD